MQAVDVTSILLIMELCLACTFVSVHGTFVALTFQNWLCGVFAIRVAVVALFGGLQMNWHAF